MKFFPVVCGRPTWRLWSQHAVIMLQDRRSGGPLIIFPTKSICLAAIMFFYARDGIIHVTHFAILQTLFLYFCHQDLEDESNALVEELF